MDKESAEIFCENSGNSCDKDLVAESKEQVLLHKENDQNCTEGNLYEESDLCKESTNEECINESNENFNDDECLGTSQVKQICGEEASGDAGIPKIVDVFSQNLEDWAVCTNDNALEKEDSLTTPHEYGNEGVDSYGKDNNFSHLTKENDTDSQEHMPNNKSHINETLLRKKSILHEKKWKKFLKNSKITTELESYFQNHSFPNNAELHTLSASIGTEKVVLSQWFIKKRKDMRYMRARYLTQSSKNKFKTASYSNANVEQKLKLNVTALFGIPYAARKVLKLYIKQCKYPTDDEIERMSKTLKLTKNQIRVWFRKQRFSHGTTKEMNFLNSQETSKSYLNFSCKELVSDSQINVKKEKPETDVNVFPDSFEMDNLNEGSFLSVKKEKSLEIESDYSDPVGSVVKHNQTSSSETKPNQVKLVGTRKMKLQLEQKEKLLKIFKENPYPDFNTKLNLASQMNVSLQSVNCWFVAQRRWNLKSRCEKGKNIGHATGKLTSEQKEKLLKFFKRNPCPDSNTKRKLAMQMNVSFQSLCAWFWAKRRWNFKSQHQKRKDDKLNVKSGKKMELAKGNPKLSFRNIEKNKILKLQEYFEKNKSPNIAQCKALSKTLGLTVSKIREWFYENHCKVTSKSNNKDLTVPQSEEGKTSGALTLNDRSKLLNYYSHNNDPNIDEIRNFARSLGLRIQSVAMWFFHQRKRDGLGKSQNLDKNCMNNIQDSEKRVHNAFQWRPTASINPIVQILSNQQTHSGVINIEPEYSEPPKFMENACKELFTHTVLQEAFAKNNYPEVDQLVALSKESNMTFPEVTEWFQEVRSNAETNTDPWIMFFMKTNPTDEAYVMMAQLCCKSSDCLRTMHKNYRLVLNQALSSLDQTYNLHAAMESLKSKDYILLQLIELFKSNQIPLANQMAHIAKRISWTKEAVYKWFVKARELVHKQCLSELGGSFDPVLEISQSVLDETSNATSSTGNKKQHAMDTGMLKYLLKVGTSDCKKILHPDKDTWRFFFSSNPNEKDRECVSRLYRVSDEDASKAWMRFRQNILSFLHDNHYLSQFGSRSWLNEHLRSNLVQMFIENQYPDENQLEFFSCNFNMSVRDLNTWFHLTRSQIFHDALAIDGNSIIDLIRNYHAKHDIELKAKHKSAGYNQDKTMHVSAKTVRDKRPVKQLNKRPDNTKTGRIQSAIEPKIISISPISSLSEEHTDTASPESSFHAETSVHNDSQSSIGQFNEYQLRKLREMYETNSNPSMEEVMLMSKLLDISLAHVVEWYAEQRLKQQKEHETGTFTRNPVLPNTQKVHNIIPEDVSDIQQLPEPQINSPLQTIQPHLIAPFSNQTVKNMESEDVRGIPQYTYTHIGTSNQTSRTSSSVLNVQPQLLTLMPQTSTAGFQVPGTMALQQNTGNCMSTTGFQVPGTMALQQNTGNCMSTTGFQVPGTMALQQNIQPQFMLQMARNTDKVITTPSNLNTPVNNIQSQVTTQVPSSTGKQLVLISKSLLAQISTNPQMTSSVSAGGLKLPVAMPNSQNSGILSPNNSSDKQVPVEKDASLPCNVTDIHTAQSVFDMPKCSTNIETPDDISSPSHDEGKLTSPSYNKDQLTDSNATIKEKAPNLKRTRRKITKPDSTSGIINNSDTNSILIDSVENASQPVPVNIVTNAYFKNRRGLNSIVQSMVLPTKCMNSSTLLNNPTKENVTDSVTTPAKPQLPDSTVTDSVKLLKSDSTEVVEIEDSSEEGIEVVSSDEDDECIILD